MSDDLTTLTRWFLDRLAAQEARLAALRGAGNRIRYAEKTSDLLAACRTCQRAWKRDFKARRRQA